jgi:hypothetical protein
MSRLVLTLVRVLALVTGLFIAGGGVYAAWIGSGVDEDIRGLEAQIYKQRSDNAYHRAGEAGEKKIEELQQQVEEKKSERNIWFGAAAGAVAFGVALALLPLMSRKRKPSATAPVPEPVPDQGAPSL